MKVTNHSIKIPTMSLAEQSLLSGPDAFNPVLIWSTEFVDQCPYLYIPIRWDTIAVHDYVARFRQPRLSKVQ